jgi:hypothetical protein
MRQIADGEAGLGDKVFWKCRGKDGLTDIFVRATISLLPERGNIRIKLEEPKEDHLPNKPRVSSSFLFLKEPER